MSRYLRQLPKKQPADLRARKAKHSPARAERLVAARAGFLCSEIGVTPGIRADHADYIGHWLNVLKEDKRDLLGRRARTTRRRLPEWHCRRTR
jgi:antirestriction protein ArdC